MSSYPDQVRRVWSVLVVLLVLAGCTTTAVTSTTGATGSESLPESESAPSIPDLDSTNVVAFMDEITQVLLERDPEWMTDLGLADRNDRLTPVDLEYRAGTVAIALAALDEMASIDVDIDADTAISYSVLEWWLGDIVAGGAFAQHDNPVNYITGAHVNLPEFLIDIHPILTVRDAEDYVSRLEGMGPKLDEIRRQVEDNADAGFLMPARSRDIARWQVQQILSVGPDDQALVRELDRRMSEAGMATDDRDRLVDAATEALRTTVLPAYDELRRTLDRVDVRSTDGVWDLPNGDDYYRWVLRHHTTSEMDPDAMHEWGLSEVARVRAELDSTLSALGYDTSDLNRAIGQAIADAGRVSLSTAADRQAFLDLNTQIVDEAYEAFAGMFSLLPEAEVIIQRPAPTREGGSGAYYRNPDLAGTRPGIYYLSMGGESRTAHDFKTTTYHEAVPGHHFQLALQSESDNPLHQRVVVFSGYAEGWALYAERLAFEAGLYDDDPFGNVGRLQLELLRAARVVTDTGIHAMRWTRDEAIQYHMEATALPEPWSTNEVDRYIVWPGQAPGYLLGMDVILQARNEAMDELGSSFDISGFHDAVLRHGSLPLPLVHEAVGAWSVRAEG